MCKFVKKRGKHLALKTSGILKFNFQKGVRPLNIVVDNGGPWSQKE